MAVLSAMMAIDAKVVIMVKSIQGTKGRFISATGRAVPLTHARVVSARIPDDIYDELAAMSSGDRCDFIRAAIVEKLQRSKQEI